MKRLLVLALLTCVLLPAGFSLAATSPLASPLPKPPGLENCPREFIENVWGCEWQTCNARAVEELGLDVESKYVSGCSTGAYTGPSCDGLLRWDLVTPTPMPTKPKPTSTPTATPTVTVAPVVEWLRDDLWMGRCRMWTDGQRVTRVECP